MATIIRYDGIYLKNIKISDGNFNNTLFCAAFFIEDYLCFDMQPLDEPVSIDTAFLRNMFSWKKEIYEAIRNNETQAPDMVNILVKYSIKSNGVIEAHLPDSNFIQKDIILIPQIFGGVGLIVDTKGNEYDLTNYENSGLKTRRLVNNASLKFYKL